MCGDEGLKNKGSPPRFRNNNFRAECGVLKIETYANAEAVHVGIAREAADRHDGIGNFVI